MLREDGKGREKRGRRRIFPALMSRGHGPTATALALSKLPLPDERRRDNRGQALEVAVAVGGTARHVDHRGELLGLQHRCLEGSPRRVCTVYFLPLARLGLRAARRRQGGAVGVDTPRFVRLADWHSATVSEASLPAAVSRGSGLTPTCCGRAKRSLGGNEAGPPFQWVKRMSCQASPACPDSKTQTADAKRAEGAGSCYRRHRAAPADPASSPYERCRYPINTQTRSIFTVLLSYLSYLPYALTEDYSKCPVNTGPRCAVG